jgi:hypothetical protein
LPCTETIDFSFLVDYLFEGPDDYAEHLISVISLTSSGPLAPFNTMGAVGDYFAFSNSALDEIDVNGPRGDTGLAPTPFPDLRDSLLFGCGFTSVDPICVQDFVTPSGNDHIRGTLEYTVSTVPEGSSRLYLLVGVGLGLLGMLARTQKYCSGLPPG